LADGQRDESRSPRDERRPTAAQVTEQRLPIHLQIAEHEAVRLRSETGELPETVEAADAGGIVPTAAQVYQRCKEMVGIA
jgi:hypothetical protein